LESSCMCGVSRFENFGVCFAYGTVELVLSGGKCVRVACDAQFPVETDVRTPSTFSMITTSS